MKLTTPALGMICAKGIVKTSVVTGKPEMHVVEVYGAELVGCEPGLDVERGYELELDDRERGGVGVGDARCEREEGTYVVGREAGFEDIFVPDVFEAEAGPEFQPELHGEEVDKHTVPTTVA